MQIGADPAGRVGEPHPIGPRSAIQHIAAGATEQDIGAIAALDCVGPAIAVQHIVRGVTDDVVIAIPGERTSAFTALCMMLGKDRIRWREADFKQIIDLVADGTYPAGLVIHEAQTIPTKGQVFSFHGFRFEILERQDNRITGLKIRRLM